MRATLDVAFERLGSAELDHESLRGEASAVLRRHVVFDAACWATLDPVTVMWTHCLLDGAERDHGFESALFDHEYGDADDVLRLTDLAAGPRPVGAVVEATAGRPERSPRYRDLLAPIGVSDELRLVFADGGSPWGVLHLLRSGGAFGPADVALIGGLSRPFGAALRRSLLRAAVGRATALAEPPGTIEVDRDGRVAAVSPEAATLLGTSDPRALPQVVSVVVARARAGRTASATWCRPDGTWVALHPTTLGGRTVVIVERVAAYHLAELIVRAHGLTPRERAVVEEVARGRSTIAIARALGVSEWTVQDHLKSVFAKFGVRSRAEVVAALFFDHYAPQHALGATPSPYGWYLDAAPEPEPGRTGTAGSGRPPGRADAG